MLLRLYCITKQVKYYLALSVCLCVCVIHAAVAVVTDLLLSKLSLQDKQLTEERFKQISNYMRSNT